MLTMLLAYDAAGNVIATIDSMVAKDAAGNVTGLVDFAAHEEAGGELLEVWNVDGAAGSKVWPEWLGGRAHDFTVETAGPPGRKRIVALVHKTSGHRRERAAIEAAIEAVPLVDGAKDLRAVLGGPQRALILDDQGRTARPRKVKRPDLPVIRANRPV